MTEANDPASNGLGVRGLLPVGPMNKKQETAIAAGALTIGAVLLSRGMRATRAFEFRDK